jgi:phage tail tape-measure protein
MYYWFAATILVTANAACVGANMLMLPGNWFMVGTLCLFLLTAGTTTGPDWTTLIVVVVLAVLGEILEMFTGSATASKKGASRRAVVLSMVLSMAGSIAGAFVIPIPVIGTAIGAIAGAAVGAFAGAWMGEAWKGTEPMQRTEIGTAAMSGRMIGMLAKLSIGAAIFVFQVVSLF